MTFDKAQEAFREEQSKQTARQYYNAAVTYRHDDMIGFDTFASAIKEIMHWCLRNSIDLGK